MSFWDVMAKVVNGALDYTVSSNASRMRSIEQSAKEQGKTLSPEFYEKKERAIAMDKERRDQKYNQNKYRGE